MSRNNPGTESNLNALQQLIHDVQTHNSPIDRRRSPRYAFSTVQRLAPCDNPDAPTGQLKFATVHCADVSTGGLSLIMPSQPTFKHAVMELKTPAKPIYVVVEVVRIEPAPTTPGQLLVGCRFLKRIAL
mgnify:CR=1 FL=1